MKKALVALLALAVTGALIAQDAPSLKFSGYLNSGLEYDQLGSATGLLKSYAQDAGVVGYRMNLDGAYVNGNVGANFEMRSAGDQGSAAYLMNFGYVWANLASNMVKVKAGLVDDGSWNTAGDIGGDSGEGTGVLVLVMPMDGLNFGAGMYADNSKGIPGDATYTAGFAYTMAKTVGLEASMKIQNSQAQSAIGGFQVLMVPQLSAAFEYQVTNLYDFSNTGLNTITETLSYDLSPAKVGVTAYEWLSQDSSKDLGFKVNPWVSYTSGPFTPKLGVTYVSNDLSDSTNYMFNGKADKNYSFQVKPQVTFAAGPNANIVAAYAFTSYGDNTVQNGIKGYNSSNTVYVDFVWSF